MGCLGSKSGHLVGSVIFQNLAPNNRASHWIQFRKRGAVDHETEIKYGKVQFFSVIDISGLLRPGRIEFCERFHTLEAARKSIDTQGNTTLDYEHHVAFVRCWKRRLCSSLASMTIQSGSWQMKNLMLSDANVQTIAEDAISRAVYNWRPEGRGSRHPQSQNNQLELRCNVQPQCHSASGYIAFFYADISRPPALLP
ncbi:hypothetical protein K440DRAFT_637909 [Wilcoxina mikolae CBS 423.85]|nr:hypothetical protein K440DRAFT_637909 [Wilcoxina mikolae CBS 423.85]